jgi:hypothetical protein
MTNPSKRKGTKFESEVCEYLRLRGFEVERRALTGTQDKGDIAGIPGWIIECKNQNSSNWAEWMDETEAERRHAGANYGLLVVRRRMKSIERAYAVLPLRDAVEAIMADEHWRATSSSSPLSS